MRALKAWSFPEGLRVSPPPHSPAVSSRLSHVESALEDGMLDTPAWSPVGDDHTGGILMGDLGSPLLGRVPHMQHVRDCAHLALQQMKSVVLICLV